jgi:hypothetical protein
MFNLSAAMAGEFVEAATQMTEQISSLGPTPLRGATKKETKEQSI